MIMNSSSFESPKPYIFPLKLKNSNALLSSYVIFYINRASLMILNRSPLYFLLWDIRIEKYADGKRDPFIVQKMRKLGNFF